MLEVHRLLLLTEHLPRAVALYRDFQSHRIGAKSAKLGGSVPPVQFAEGGAKEVPSLTSPKGRLTPSTGYLRQREEASPSASLCNEARRSGVPNNREAEHGRQQADNENVKRVSAVVGFFGVGHSILHQHEENRKPSTEFALWQLPQLQKNFSLFAMKFGSL